MLCLAAVSLALFGVGESILIPFSSPKKKLSMNLSSTGDSFTVARHKRAVRLVSPGLSLTCYNCPKGQNGTCLNQQECSASEDSCLKLTSDGKN